MRIGGHGYEDLKFSSAYPVECLTPLCVSFGAISSFAYDDPEDEPEAFKTWDAYLKAHRYDCQGHSIRLTPS